MALPLIPLAILGAGALGGTGAFFGLRGSGAQTINNETKKISYQTNNTNKITTFDFNSAVFERDSSVIIKDVLENSTDQRTSQSDAIGQESIRTDNSTIWLLVAGAGVVGFLLWRNRQ